MLAKRGLRGNGHIILCDDTWPTEESMQGHLEMREFCCALDDEPAAFAGIKDLEGRETTTWFQGMDGNTYRGRKRPKTNVILVKMGNPDLLPAQEPEPVPQFEAFFREHHDCTTEDLEMAARKFLWDIGIQSPSLEHVRIATQRIGLRLFGKTWKFRAPMNKKSVAFHQVHKALRLYTQSAQTA